MLFSEGYWTKGKNRITQGNSNCHETGQHRKGTQLIVTVVRIRKGFCLLRGKELSKERKLCELERNKRMRLPELAFFWLCGE